MSKTITKEGVQVAIGQIWQDLDTRMANKQCKVASLDSENGKAFMVNIVTNSKSKVSIRRMHKNSTGWKLVSEPT